MKKHIFGLAVFSFIVGAAAFVYGLFSFSEVTPFYEEVSVPQYVPAERTHCKMKKSNYDSIEVKQAVFDWKTKRFYWQIDMATVNEPIDLMFFTKGNQGIHFINGERVGNAVSSDGVLRFSSSYDWQDKISSLENLYVIAQTASETKDYSENYQVYNNKFQPKFDATKATAVTIDYSK